MIFKIVLVFEVVGWRIVVLVFAVVTIVWSVFQNSISIWNIVLVFEVVGWRIVVLVFAVVTIVWSVFAGVAGKIVLVFE